MTHRFSWLRFAAAACVAGTAFAAVPAHAGIFDDDQARQAILDLRSKTDSLSSQLSAAQRTILDQSNRLDQLNQQVATLRGQNEDMANQLSTLQKQQKDYYTDLDTRLKKFEPQQQTVDGVQGEVQPGETDSFNAASQQFRSGDFKNAATSFRSFISKYPNSPYQPTAQYWLGMHCATTRARRRSGKVW
jgi:TolA-binding protein